MADQSELLEYMIKTVFDPKGTQQAVQGMQRVAQEAKKTDDALRGIEAQWNRRVDEMGRRKKMLDEIGASAAGDRNWALGFKEQAAGHEELSRKVSASTLKGKEFKKLMHEIAMESPLAGLALKAAFSPTGAAIMAAVIAFKYLHEEIQKIGEAAATSDFERFTDQTKLMEEGLLQTALATAAAERDMHRLATASDTASQALERQLKVHEALNVAQEKLDDARRRLELEQAGGIKDPVQRAAKRLEIEERYARKTKERQDEEARFQLSELHRKSFNEQAMINAADIKLPGLRAAAAAAGNADLEKKKLADEEARLKQIEDDYAKKVAERDTLQGSFDKRILPSPLQAKQLVELNGAVDGLANQMEQQRKIVEQRKGMLPDRLATIATAQEAVRQVEQDRAGALGRKNEIDRGIKTATEISRIEAGGRAAIAPIESAIRGQNAINDMTGTPIGAAVVGGANALAAGQNAGASGAASLAALTQLLVAINQNNKATLDLIKASAGDVGALAKRIAEIESAMANKSRLNRP